MFLYWSTTSISKAWRKKDPEPSQPRQLKINIFFFPNQTPFKKKNHMDKICWIFQSFMGDSKWILWGFCAFLGFWPWNKTESCLTFTSPARFRSPWKQLPAFWPSSIIIWKTRQKPLKTYWWELEITENKGADLVALQAQNSQFLFTSYAWQTITP